LILLFFYCLSSAASARDYHLPYIKTIDYIEGVFFDIALKGEYSQLPPVLKKWEEPLRVWVYQEGDSSNESYYTYLLHRHFRLLSALTGLNIQFESNKALSNVKVYIAPTQRLESILLKDFNREVELLGEVVCFGSIRYGLKDAVIKKGFIFVPSDAFNLNNILPCVIEETTQMLGLLNDSKFARNTIFSDQTPDKYLTGLDYILLRLMYHPDLKSGMSSVELSPIIRRQLNKMMLSGELPFAQSYLRMSMEKLK